MRSLFLSALVLVAFLVGHVVAAPAVSCTFDDNGLTSFAVAGAPLLKSGVVQNLGVSFGKTDGTEAPANGEHPQVHFDPKTRELSHTLPWGGFRVRYVPADERLNLDVTIENKTDEPITAVGLYLMELQFPRRPLGEAWEKRYQPMADNDGELGAVVADCAKFVLTLCNENFGTRMRIGFTPGAVSPETWFLHINPPQWNGERPTLVGPKSTRTFRFSLRVSSPGTPLKVIAADLIKKFTEQTPFQLRWADRRPIGMLALASGAHSSAMNPRGWLNDEKLDAISPGGQKRFREKMFAAADRTIRILQEMHAQGMIFWDMEGEQFANINYVGDPRMTATLAPEMDAIAPEFFERFHKAGLRTGVCIRPSKIVPGWDGKSRWQHSHMGFDVVEEMSRKIAYAKKRLGCLLFYVDSNVRYFNKPDGSVDSRLLEAAAWQRLMKAHPDILLIPEIPRLDYWSCTAPYQELRPHTFGNHAATDARVLDFYPRAFSIINPVDGPAAEHHAQIVAGLRRGDVLLFRSWFQDEQNKLFKTMLSEAAAAKESR